MDRCNYTINPDNTLTGSGAVNVVPNNSSSVSNSAHQASPSLLFSQHGLMRQTYGLSTCETMNYPYVESFQQNESNRRRRIEEALSFLDQVKSQFSTAPKVYSDFLDIMRDFKSQTIDTPGVIRRVSKLFRGRPNLIVGFNPFLPPGFELRVEGSRIIICEPSGKTQLVDEGIRELPVTPRTSCSPSVAPVPTQSGDKPGSVVVSNVPETNVVKIQDQPVTSISPPNASSLSSSHSLHHTPPEQSSAEINQAINYVNKIKARFHDRPDVYKQFLEILHSYQQEQQSGHHQGDSNMITEKQVYSSVAALFESEPDLLREFSQFLPDACGILNKPSPVSADKSFPYGTDQVAKLKICRSAVGTVDRAAMVISPQPVCVPKVSPSQTCSMKVSSSPPLTPTLSSSTGSGLTNPPIPPTLPISSFVPTSTLSSSSPCHTPVTCLPATSTVFCPSKSRSPPRNIQQKRVFSPLRSAAKKAKLNSSDVIVYDVELSEAKKYATAEEYLFFDKVRKLLTDEIIFDNFLRCIVLYNQSIISKNELLELVQPFLEKDAELMKFFRGMLGMNDIQTTSDVCDDVSDSGPQDRGMSDLALQIDYATCKRLGVSYRSLPDNYIRPKCSGRTALCHSVLNDTWVSFPSWSSEDTSCVHSKKSQYEEFIYRTEDERYELDIVIEVNKSALETLEMINRKMQRMKPEDANKFKLDANIGSSSPSLMYRAVKRIYGEHVHKILNGLRKNPAVVVPKVIERMRMKEREWREAQVQFNRIWREQNEKYFAKSLDHQGLTFKQTDTKNLRSKMIIHHFETLYDERESRMEEGGPPEWGPHGIFDYPDDMSVLYDVNDLVIHYVKRQQNMQKEEKRQAKRCLKRLLPELFNLPPQEMSDQEDSEDCGSSG
ncbi:hypothetical protein AB6A40_009090 [Gnathostoma spinigerum]|uniref:Paired amphipathic helix protein Sin3b n=1 Tax=Gnathostoma spinigerum TaxID=75299 RepID=A0ABD6EST5_9BILA